ncbi:MAG: recombinase family protein [Thermoanaerobaculia bacterium]|nr:recombinase family protein [Thermoanaerobaculia bacterium]
MREYAQRNDIEIVEEFVFQESAGLVIRRKFEQVLRFLRTHPKVKILIAQNIDRATRNDRDAVDLDQMRLNKELELHFVMENLVLNAASSSSDLVVWDGRVFAAKLLLRRMRDQAMSDHRRQARDGKWAFKAPLGYQNIRDQASGKSNVVLDPVRAHLVQKMFEEYATGLWSIREVASRARDRGLTSKFDRPVSSHSVDRMLRNAFYCGVMEVKGEKYAHQYERLISRGLFEQCEKVLDQRAKNPVKLQGRPFVFRGLLKCAASGRAVSTDAKLRRYKDGRTQEFVYLTPRNPENTEKRLWVQESVVLDQVGSALGELVFPAGLMESLLPAVEAACVEGRAFQRHTDLALKQQLDAVDSQLERLTDLALKT